MYEWDFKGKNPTQLDEIVSYNINEFGPGLEDINIDFIKNLIYPTIIRDVKQENGIVSIMANDAKSKGILIGRDRRNLDAVKSIVKRYFKIDDIKVV